jgi:hypothetical protein
VINSRKIRKLLRKKNAPEKIIRKKIIRKKESALTGEFNLT